MRDSWKRSFLMRPVSVSVAVRWSLPLTVALSSATGCGGCGGGGNNAVAPESGVDAAPDMLVATEAAADMSVTDAPSTGDADGATVIPISAGGTGAFGIVTAAGKQKMYLPTTTPGTNGNAVIAVVDLGLAGNGVAGAPALIKTIDLGTTNIATNTGGDSSTIVAASQNTRDLWFIDPTTDTLVAHTMLDASFGQSSFSGRGGGYVTGIAADSGSHRAILSVWNGFALVDLTTRAVTSVLQAPPSENFGFDSVHGVIYAPFYDCRFSYNPGLGPDASTPAACGMPMTPGDASTVMTDGLSVIRLSDGDVFTYEDPSSMSPNTPVGSEPDSASVDPSNQLVVVPAEGGGVQNVLDFSKAVFDTTTHTVTAPHQVMPNVAYTGVAIDPGSHLAFLEAEASPNIALYSVPGANAGSQSWVGATMPNLPGSVVFNNLGDPHGIGVATSILDGKGAGFVVDATWRWVARIDLQALASLGQPDASIAADSSSVDAVVTYLDATRIE